MSASQSEIDSVCRDLEDAELREGLTLELNNCEELGIEECFCREWALGVPLSGAEAVGAFSKDDYPSVKQSFELAAKEFDRLTSLRKIFWYPPHLILSNLDVFPSNLIVKSTRLRLVHDWTAVGLNQSLQIPPVAFDTIDSLVQVIRPGCFMAGLDIQDCFLHWPVHGDVDCSVFHEVN